MFQFKLKEDVTALFKRLPEALQKAMTTDLQRQSLYFIGDVQRTQMTGRPGLNVQTGKLRRDWFAKTGIQGGALTVRIWSTTKYVAIHEFGGVIVPRQAKVLRFKVGGRWVFAKRVVIPPRLRLRAAFKANALERYRKVFGRVFNRRGAFKGVERTLTVGSA